MRYSWLYPDNWDALAWTCKDRAGWRYEFCGIEQGTTVVSKRTGLVYPVYLAAVHLDHDPWNPSPRLAALCPSCHGRYDHSWLERERWVALEEFRHRLLVQRYLYGLSGEEVM